MRVRTNLPPIVSTTQLVRRTVRVLIDAGFTDITTSQEDGKAVITITSSQAMFSANMRTIANASNEILIRGRTKG